MRTRHSWDGGPGTCFWLIDRGNEGKTKMKRNGTTLTLMLYALVLAVILLSSWIVGKWTDNSNWVTGGLIGFAALVLLVAIVGSRRKAV